MTDTPSTVTVRQGDQWQTSGTVTKRAPYSLYVTYTAPDGERAGWFVWEPGKANHGRMHGVAAEFAHRIEAA